MDLRKRFSAMKSRFITLNVHDAVMQLTEGNCDLLIAYHHASQPLQLNPDCYEMMSLGQETLAAFAKADDTGQPMFVLPAASFAKVPFLSYGTGAYLGRLVEVIIKQADVPLNLEPIDETDMAEGLKAMAARTPPPEPQPAARLDDRGAAGRFAARGRQRRAPYDRPVLGRWDAVHRAPRRRLGVSPAGAAAGAAAVGRRRGHVRAAA